MAGFGSLVPQFPPPARAPRAASGSKRPALAVASKNDPAENPAAPEKALTAADWYAQATHGDGTVEQSSSSHQGGAVGQRGGVYSDFIAER